MQDKILISVNEDPDLVWVFIQIRDRLTLECQETIAKKMNFKYVKLSLDNLDISILS